MRRFEHRQVERRDLLVSGVERVGEGGGAWLAAFAHERLLGWDSGWESAAAGPVAASQSGTAVELSWTDYGGLPTLTRVRQRAFNKIGARMS
ncbi:hypothetical protein GCM10011492_19230 [Flexivirga endophytica]|uniref:Uncharacterized protein n=1 Tax=Flexivirga endophytica TaxID=1849103 RepID=A0A916T5C8_9MICO|nr:hypothetical protein GCM10011492_19230 [Flexivirga endophytica]GHB50120.1 hypothetical protein GCM10008112_18500 [Flexivirga endophytica]